MADNPKPKMPDRIWLEDMTRGGMAFGVSLKRKKDMTAYLRSEKVRELVDAYQSLLEFFLDDLVEEGWQPRAWGKIQTLLKLVKEQRTALFPDGLGKDGLK